MDSGLVLSVDGPTVQSALASGAPNPRHTPIGYNEGWVFTNYYTHDTPVEEVRLGRERGCILPLASPPLLTALSIRI
ncbi:hypothetical protein EDD25_0538 [Cryobacterium psychrophilum]|nr:hypothetical protein EDD25_0538 [Cryobacterium psychrophilum]